MVNTREVYHVPVAWRSEAGVGTEAGSAVQLAAGQDSAQQLLISQSSHGRASAQGVARGWPRKREETA